VSLALTLWSKSYGFDMTSPKFNLSQKIRWVRLLIKGFFSSFEKDTANAILKMSNVKNPVILDIGANIGLFTKAFAGSSRKPKRIISVEPSTYVYEILKRVSRNLPNVNCFQLAISDRKGFVNLNMPVKPSGSIRVGLSHIGKSEQKEHLTEKVKTNTLDDFINEHVKEKIDIVKIDVEGAEGLVLSGARKLMQDDRPIWFVEISDFGERFNGCAEDIFDDFLALNYQPFIYTIDGRFQKKTMLETGNNYLFIPEEKIQPEVLD
tara:strand:- start:93 stop:884 length:792 start_codon:yes stop_codon:yes gene_type:complete